MISESIFVAIRDLVAMIKYEYNQLCWLPSAISLATSHVDCDTRSVLQWGILVVTCSFAFTQHLAYNEQLWLS